MKANIIDGISLRIQGELGKYNTLPIDVLINISKNFQELINNIALYDLPSSDPIDLNNFKLEIKSFNPGSAIPTYILTPRVQTVIGDSQYQRIEVAKKTDEILELINSGDFRKFKDFYPDAFRRNAMIESVYNFTKSFENSPVTIGSLSTNGDFNKIFEVHKLKENVKKQLLVEIISVKSLEKEIYDAVATVKVTRSEGNKLKTKINKVFDNKDSNLSIATKDIYVNNRTYSLNHNLTGLIDIDDDNTYIISNELLNIVGTGLNEKEATLSFYEEFDFLYYRLKDEKDSKLSKKLKLSKDILLSLVNSVYNGNQ